MNTGSFSFRSSGLLRHKMRISPWAPRLDFSTRATRRSSDFALDIGLGFRWSLRSGLSSARLPRRLLLSCLFSSLALSSASSWLSLRAWALSCVNLLLSLKSNLALSAASFRGQPSCGDLSVPRLPSVPFHIGLLSCVRAPWAIPPWGCFLRRTPS